MFKYIGIRGHRGAGKNTIGFLLGAAIEYYVKNHSWDGFYPVYKNAVDTIIEQGNNGQIPDNDYTHVYLESFADTAKITLSQIIGIPSEWMYDDWNRDATIIKLDDFTYWKASDKLSLAAKKERLGDQLFTAAHLYNFVTSTDPVQAASHVYITLRELIIYYSKYVMQTYFGPNIWVKSLQNNEWDNERFFASKKTIYKIYVDCKFPSEISYIYKNNGKIIKVSRTNNVKNSTDISGQLDSDNRYDFELSLDGNLLNEDTIEMIKSITAKIVSND